MLNLAIGLIAAEVTILLLLRAPILWYFKVNQHLALLRSIDQSLKCLPAVRTEAQRLRRVS